MRIEHVALWVEDLEKVRAFYVRHFGARSGSLYENPTKGFRSFFLYFESGARLELMNSGALLREPSGTQRGDSGARLGFAHIAIIVGDDAEVDRVARRLAAEGVPVVDGPRRTGDGYYEAVVLDPDGNRIEITAGSRVGAHGGGAAE